MDEENKLDYVEEEVENSSEEFQEDSFEMENETPIQQVDNLAVLNTMHEGFEIRKQMIVFLAEKTKEEYSRLNKSSNVDEYKKYNLSHLRQIALGLTKLYKLNDINAKTLDGAITIAKYGPKKKEVIDTCNEYLKQEAVKFEKKRNIAVKKILKFDPYVVSKLKEVERFLNNASIVTKDYSDDERKKYIDYCIENKKANQNMGR